MQLTFVLVLVSLCIYHSKQCSEKTFDKVYVLVEEKNSKTNQIVSGCISPKTLKYSNLKYLKITGQDLYELKEGAVSNIPDKFYLSVTNNNLSTIDAEAFYNLPGLESASLDHNNINWIESNAFDSLPSLDTINLENNHLELLLQNTFVNLPNLTLISLDGNKLEVFKQEWFYNTPNLQFLFVNDNALTSLPKAAFITLPSLRGISLNNNSIVHINSKAFMNLDQLTNLDLGKNKLVSVDFDFTTVPNLSSLAVHQNLLNYLSDDCLKRMKNSLTAIWIYLNPWQCPCLDKVLQWGTEQNIKVLWQCSNTELTCIVTDNPEGQCVGSAVDELFAERQKHFTTAECLKRHI